MFHRWFWPTLLIPLIFLAPENPWWLVRKGRHDEAKQTLLRLTKSEDVHRNIDSHLAFMVRTVDHERELSSGTSYKSCFKGTDRRRTLIVIACYSIQLLSGNSLRGYSTYYFQQAGLATTQSFNLSIVGVVLGLVGMVMAVRLSPIIILRAQLKSKSNPSSSVVLHSSLWSPHHFPVGTQRPAPDLGRHRWRGCCADPASQPRSRVVHWWPAARLILRVRLHRRTRGVRLHYRNPVLDSAQQVGIRLSLDLCRGWHRRQCHYALPAQQDGMELGCADWILLGRHHAVEPSLCVFLHSGDKRPDYAGDGYFV